MRLAHQQQPTAAPFVAAAMHPGGGGIRDVNEHRRADRKYVPDDLHQLARLALPPCRLKSESECSCWAFVGHKESSVGVKKTALLNDADRAAGARRTSSLRTQRGRGEGLERPCGEMSLEKVVYPDYWCGAAVTAGYVL